MEIQFETLLLQNGPPFLSLMNIEDKPWLKSDLDLLLPDLSLPILQLIKIFCPLNFRKLDTNGNSLLVIVCIIQ